MAKEAELAKGQDEAGKRQAERSENVTTLVDRAKLGDTEAFGELIEQHRHKAHSWAQRMTGDPHMADDIVQDALIRAFLHLGSLTDTSRFLPWLYRIVRNQANMRLRRGGPHRKEKPFASLGVPDSEELRVDWEDLDSILFHLSRKAADDRDREQDPAESLLRKETFETIHALLHCLSLKERNIFKAHFFQQLSPEEIASMYGMSTGSIYTYIYRSRQKLRQEHIRVSLGLLPEKKGGDRMARNQVLQLPDWSSRPLLQTTFVDSIGRMLAMLGDQREAAELMGNSTMAFRMKISEKTTFADGLYIFDWKRTLHALMEYLGYEVSMLCGQMSDMPVPLLAAVERFPVVLPIEEAVLPFIRKYIDLGKPVLYFDTMAAKPYVHEWCLIYGYDDERRVVYATDRMRPEGKTLTYDDVTENPVRFAAGIDGKATAAEKTADRQAWVRVLRQQAEKTIAFAVQYARQGCDYRHLTNYLHYASGLAAYDRWIHHLRGGGTPNRYGMGQLAAVYAEAKHYAAEYLRGVPFEGEAMRLTLLASEAYEQAADELEKVSEEVPFIRTSGTLTPDLRERCADCLSKAKEFEAAAIGYLEKTITLIQERK